jgi:hypothetical protein
MPRAKAVAAATTNTNNPQKSHGEVEELYFRSDSAYLCLLVNRRTKLMRVIDFRAGALPSKRLYIQSVAKQEGIAKVVTLVEKDEVSSWLKVGFSREGIIPGFYKRSDGYLCGCVVDSVSQRAAGNPEKISEKTINQAKSLASDISATNRGATIRQSDEKTAYSVRDEAIKKGDVFGTFDMFGREADRVYMECTLRKTRKNVVSAEYQECFGHALIEAARLPTSDNEILALTEGFRKINEHLLAMKIVSAFCFAPYDHIEIATALTAAGYRKTGFVKQGVSLQGARKDAILWTVRLANPEDENNEDSSSGDDA